MRLPAGAAGTRLVTVVAVVATRTALLHRRDVRVELLLLLGRQNRAERRDLTLALPVYLAATLLHLRPRGRGVAALARRTRLLHHRAELLAALLHLGHVL